VQGAVIRLATCHLTAADENAIGAPYTMALGGIVKPLILISLWFGAWPRWVDFYLETCRANPDVQWLIVTDQPPPESRPPNVRFLQMTFIEMRDRLAAATQLDLSAITAPYKLCDFKPAFGHAFEPEIAGYRSFGFADIDVFFGRIRQFYTDDVLSRYDIISASQSMVSGHFAVLRNTRRMRLSYRLIPGWRIRAPATKRFGLDEHPFRRVFKSHNRLLAAIQGLFWRTQFVEQHSSAEGKRSAAPSAWTWRDGRLLRDGEPEREYLYLHFMRWQSNRWRGDEAAPWPALGDRLVQMPWQEAMETGFSASASGIGRLTSLPDGQPPHTGTTAP
jgi:hypothetical protein